MRSCAGSLLHYKNPKNSRNSSIPPSKDEPVRRRTRAFARKREEGPVVSPATRAFALKMVADPDQVVDLRPEYYRDYRSSLAQLPSFREKTRSPTIKEIFPAPYLHKQYNCGFRLGQLTQRFPKCHIGPRRPGLQKNTVAQHHQTSMAHLSRHLNYLRDKYKGHPWPRNFARLLRDAIEISKAVDPLDLAIKRAEIGQRLEGLLDRPPDKERRELSTFYRRMCRERQELFTFLFASGSPPGQQRIASGPSAMSR